MTVWFILAVTDHCRPKLCTVFIGLYEIPMYWNFSSQCITAVLHEI